MPRAARPQQRGSRPGQRRSASTNPALEKVKRQFAEFHRTHPPNTRVPDVLRQAALAAVRQGVTRTQLRRSCGVSSSQLGQWQRRVEVMGRPDFDVRDARVFSVVEDANEPATSNSHDELELRLDGWSIRVRSVDG